MKLDQLIKYRSKEVKNSSKESRHKQTLSVIYKLYYFLANQN